MPQPTPYTRQQDFTSWEASNPSTPKRGTDLDAEFDALKTTTDGIRTNLALIQADDGTLKNESVHPDAFDAESLALMGGSWTPRGAWVTATLYEVSDVVSKDSDSYVCAVEHTSGTFNTDLAAGKWLFLGVGVSQATLEAIRDAALQAETNAETAEANAETAQAAAAASATAAAGSATTASTQATNAATSATNAATSATNAGNSATAAAASAAAAATAETNAEAAQAAAEAAATYKYTSAASISRTVQARLEERASVLDFGAVAGGSGGQDNYAAFEDAIGALSNGGELFVPPSASSYKIDTTPGALAITQPGLYIVGHGRKSIILPSGANTLFAWGGGGIQGGGMRSLRFDAADMSAGDIVSVTSMTFFDMHDVLAASAYNFALVESSNTVCIFNSGALNCRGDYGIKWYGPGTARSDHLHLFRVQITGDGTAEPVAYLVDGHCHTLSAFMTGAVSVGKGLHVKNTSGSSAPSFIRWYSFNCDFPVEEAILLEEGADDRFFGIYAHGSEEQHGIVVGANVERCTFSGGKVESHEKAGFSISGDDVTIVGVDVRLNSQVGSGTHSGIEIESGASNVNIIGGKSTGTNQAYGVHAKSGSTKISVLGVDLESNATAAFLDATGVPGTFKISKAHSAVDGQQLSVPFNVNAAAASTWTNQPAADTLYLGSARHVQKIDLSRYSQCRLLVNKGITSANTGATLHLRYHTAFSSTVGDYVAIGSSAVSVAIDAASTFLASAWTDLVAGAAADVFLALVGNGGDGVISPVFGNVIAQFR